MTNTKEGRKEIDDSERRVSQKSTAFYISKKELERKCASTCILRSACFTKKDQCGAGVNCPFVHLGKHDLATSPEIASTGDTAQDSSAIAKHTQGGGNSLQATKMDTASVMLRGVSSAKAPKRTKHKVHWSHNDIKVAHFQ